MPPKKEKTNLPLKDTIHKLIDDLHIHYQSEIDNLTKQCVQSTKQIEEQSLLISELKDERENHIEQLASFTEQQTELSQRVRDLEELGVRHRLEIQQKNEEWLEAKASYKSQHEKEIKSFKDVSILNKYLKEIDELKTENMVLHKRIEATKRLKQEPFALIKPVEQVVEVAEEEEAEEVAEEEAEEEVAEEEVAEETQEVAEEVEDAAEEVSEETEEAVEETAEETAEETEEVEEPVKIDSSTFDIVEIDEIEYYLDLDQNIRDKDTLEVVGKLTDDGDAVFHSS